MTRPIDRRDSNPARALGGTIAAALLLLAWVALMCVALAVIAP